jgi:hypothetical protein
MTAQRYFYTDPLAAAWMAKHHGIRIASSVYEDGSYDGFVMPDGSEDGRYYIHPDSLHLLEPLVNDCLQIGDDLLFWVCRDDSFWEEHENDPNLKYNFIGIKAASSNVIDGARIIQRNGIAFMWPEVEK